MNLRGLLPLTLVLFAALPAFAQQPPYGYGFYGGGHASTAAEGALNGMSNVISAQGSANLSNSMAAINLEAARSANLDNRLKYTDTFFQMRQQNAAFRAAEAGPRATSQQLFQWAREEAPNRLASTQLDPVSGGIAWPLLLTGPEFAENRTKLDAIFNQRAAYHGGITQPAFLEARQLISGMQEVMRAGIRNYVPQQYTTAMSFLRSLQFELQSPAS